MSNNNPLAHALTRPEMTPVYRSDTASPQDLTPQEIKPALIATLKHNNVKVLHINRADLPAYIYLVQLDPVAAFDSGFVGRVEIGVWDIYGGVPASATADLILGDPQYTLIDTWIDEADGYNRFPLLWVAPFEGWPAALKPSQIVALRFTSSDTSTTFTVGVKVKIWLRV